MDFVDSLSLTFRKLGIDFQEAKTYATLLEKAGIEHIQDLKCKFKLLFISIETYC